MKAKTNTMDYQRKNDGQGFIQTGHQMNSIDSDNIEHALTEKKRRQRSAYTKCYSTEEKVDGANHKKSFAFFIQMLTKIIGLLPMLIGTANYQY